jgi:predicted transcriptional regulator
MYKLKMQETVIERFKNGLTPGQVQKARELFKRVTLNSICEKANVPVSAIYNILRDRDNRIDLLAKVILEAQAEIKRREQTADSLPL